MLDITKILKIISYTIREDSDYDDEFVVDSNKTLEQVETAEELIKLVEEYIKE